MTAVTIDTDQLRLKDGSTLRVPTWPKDQYTKAQLLAMVLEAAPYPRELYYVDLGATHGAVAIH